VYYAVLQRAANGALCWLRIEKRNKEGGDKERVKKSLMTLFIGQNLVS
jgi:hypothetical protein